MTTTADQTTAALVAEVEKATWELEKHLHAMWKVSTDALDFDSAAPKYTLYCHAQDVRRAVDRLRAQRDRQTGPAPQVDQP